MQSRNHRTDHHAMTVFELGVPQSPRLPVYQHKGWRPRRVDLGALCFPANGGWKPAVSFAFPESHRRRRETGDLRSPLAGTLRRRARSRDASVRTCVSRNA